MYPWPGAICSGRICPGSFAANASRPGPPTAVYSVMKRVPPATARFARSGQVADLVNVVAAVRTVRRRFATWNLVVVAIVTAWAIGLCGLGLALVGVVPGILYAILVSAHATASLADA